MNFKPNVLKVILSIILGITVGYRLGWQQSFTGWMFYPIVFGVSSIVIIGLIYFIWSLIQKKI